MRIPTSFAVAACPLVTFALIASCGTPSKTAPAVDTEVITSTRDAAVERARPDGARSEADVTADGPTASGDLPARPGQDAALPRDAGARDAAAGDRRQVEARRPNVVFILADDLGWADMGAFGGKHISTPELDRLATLGTRFTQSYVGAPVCAPSRSVLMTGQHAGHTRVRANFSTSGQRVPLEPQDVTVAEVLKAAGYATGIAGKWGLGEAGTTGVPNKQGFDEWLGYLSQSHAHDHFPEYLWKNDARLNIPENAGGARRIYADDLFTAFALDFVGRHAHHPFFLYLPYTAPHDAFEVPPDSLAAYADRPWTETQKTYAAMVSRLDRDVGRLLRRLDELKIADDTLVIFASDNGVASFGDLRMFNSSGPLRGVKRDMYEGGIRSPTIVYWPGKVPAAATSSEPWHFADVLPTLAALAGGAVPTGVDGVDVSALWLRGAPLARRFLYWEMHEGVFERAARWEHWKLVIPAPTSPAQLYDLRTDQAESRDVAAAQPAVMSAFTSFLATARTPSPHWP